MRINRQTLLKVTTETVKQRVKEDHTILAVYMHGSLNQETDPFLGTTTDIDLVFVHEYEQDIKREIQHVTDAVTFDIAHHTRTDYRVPRELRRNPWVGPAIYHYNIIHDPRHFLDFTQASLRDQFYSPTNVLGRAQVFAGNARQAWMTLLTARESSPETVAQFLQAVGDAANAIATLEGDPMPERRLLTQFFERTTSMGQPGLYPGLLELLGAGEMSADDLNHWLSAWDGAYTAASSAEKQASEMWALLPERKSYYRSAFDTQFQSSRPSDALWTLLLTWTRAASLLDGGHPARTDWENAMTQIGLLGEKMDAKMEGLDQYLDQIEETLEAWGNARGVGEF
jgi:hypothetical protein